MGGAGLKVMHEEFRPLLATWHHSEFPGVFGELTFGSQMGLGLGGRQPSTRKLPAGRLGGVGRG